MAKDKKSFLLYCDIIHTVNKLTNEQAGKLLKHILAYVNDKDPKTDDVLLQIAFEPIRQQLKRDLIKYRILCEKNRGNVNKRWNKKDTTVCDRIRPDTKHTDNDSDSDSDNNKYPTDITPAAIGEYGNKELNQLKAALVKELGVADFSDTKKKQRIYLNHLYNFIKKQPDPNRWFKKACQKLKAEDFTFRKIESIYRNIKTYIIK